MHAAGIETPVVLVGHSLGGFLARLYASTYPEDVFGLVVVDAYSELLEELTTPEKWLALVELNRAQGTDTMVPIPGYGDLETIGFGSDNAVMREALALHPLAPMPLASLGHGIPLDVPHPPEGFTAESLEALFSQANVGLANLVPDGRYFVAKESGHYVHQDQPALVIEAVRQVVTGVREPDTWYSMDSCCSS